jgi:hypothetical protein
MTKFYTVAQDLGIEVDLSAIAWESTINNDLKTKGCSTTLSWAYLEAFFNKELRIIMAGYESKFSIPTNTTQSTFDLLFKILAYYEFSFDELSSGIGRVVYWCNDTIVETGEADEIFDIAVSLVFI